MTPGLFGALTCSFAAVIEQKSRWTVELPQLYLSCIWSPLLIHSLTAGLSVIHSVVARDVSFYCPLIFAQGWEWSFFPLVAPFSTTATATGPVTCSEAFNRYEID